MNNNSTEIKALKPSKPRKRSRSTRGKTKELRLNSPLFGRAFPVFTSDVDASPLVEDGHIAEIIVNLPGIQIFKDWDGYIVDVEVELNVNCDCSGKYSVSHDRRRVDREGAFRLLLASVVPSEFRDLLPQPGGVTHNKRAAR